MDEDDKKTCRMISKMIEADDLSGLSRHLPFVRFLRDHGQNRSAISQFLDQACQKDSADVADIFLEFFDEKRDLPLF